MGMFDYLSFHEDFDKLPAGAPKRGYQTKSFQPFQDSYFVAADGLLIKCGGYRSVEEPMVMPTSSGHADIYRQFDDGWLRLRLIIERGRIIEVYPTPETPPSVIQQSIPLRIFARTAATANANLLQRLADVARHIAAAEIEQRQQTWCDNGWKHASTAGGLLYARYWEKEYNFKDVELLLQPSGDAQADREFQLWPLQSAGDIVDSMRAGSSTIDLVASCVHAHVQIAWGGDSTDRGVLRDQFSDQEHGPAGTLAATLEKAYFNYRELAPGFARGLYLFAVAVILRPFHHHNTLTAWYMLCREVVGNGGPLLLVKELPRVRGEDLLSDKGIGTWILNMQGVLDRSSALVWSDLDALGTILR